MARLQILELPAGANDDRPPFVLVVDQASEDIVNAMAPKGGSDSLTAVIQRVTELPLAEQIGARAVLVFEETVDIPANTVTFGPYSYPVTMRMQVEGDFDRFREQLDSKVREAMARGSRDW